MRTLVYLLLAASVCGAEQSANPITAAAKLSAIFAEVKEAAISAAEEDSPVPQPAMASEDADRKW